MFTHSSYSLRKKVLQLFGGSYQIFDPEGKLVLFASQKAFKLREDIRLYSSEAKTEEILTIHARNIIDFSAAYDVIDSKSGQKIGVLKRKGMKSILIDEWQILDANDVEIGLIKEDSALLATLRRFLSNLIPQNYDAFMNGIRVADLRQNFNPFIYKLTIDFSMDTENKFDKRLGLAAGVLLAAIEGKQQ